MAKSSFNEHQEAATKGVLSEKVFIEILQSSQENTCVRVSFLIKFQAFSLSRYVPFDFDTKLYNPE